MQFLKKILFLCLFSFSLHAYISYDVKFIGVPKKALTDLEGVSELLNLQSRPPRSINALRYRADADIPKLIKMLNAYGYYDAKINMDFEEIDNKILVNVFFDIGPQYTIQSYSIYSSPCENKQEIPIKNKISLEKIKIKLNKAAISQEILNSRAFLLNELAVYGYPLSKIKDQHIIVDKEKKVVDISVCVDMGPKCKFGKTTVTGIVNVEPRYILRQIQWKEGEEYSENKINETRKRLHKTELFSSIRITHDDEADENEELPITISFIEAKHKNVSIGASYATIDGFGGTISYTNRNFRNVGEVLSLQAEVSQIGYEGTATYMKPNFKILDQDYVLQGKAIREDISPYLAFTYSLVSRIDRQYNKRFNFSWGIKGAYIDVTHSANDGKFALLGLPIYLKYTTTTSILNPTKGITFIYNVIPYQNTIHDKDFFIKQKFTTSWYIPTSKSQFLVFAWRVQLGSILGAPYTSVPMTILFLGGSDEDLRGYKYRTVSPRNYEGKPLGGRSAIYWTFEPRLRLTESLGIIGFTDWGNVQNTAYPTVYGKWHKSVGFGLRYFTFFGPLRLDVGFPLNRRSDKDKRYRIYISIGQTF